MSREDIANRIDDEEGYNTYEAERKRKTLVALRHFSEMPDDLKLAVIPTLLAKGYAVYVTDTKNSPSFLISIIFGGTDGERDHFYECDVDVAKTNRKWGDYMAYYGGAIYFDTKPERRFPCHIDEFRGCDSSTADVQAAINDCDGWRPGPYDLSACSP